MQSPPRHIDIPALKVKFRAACAEFGVDPLEGATSYQVANLRAAQRIAERRNAPDAGWGRDHNLWRAEDSACSIRSGGFFRGMRMNFITTGEPPIRSVVERRHFGESGGIVQLVLDCGHTYSGLVKDGWAARTEHPCISCVTRLEKLERK